MANYTDHVLKTTPLVYFPLDDVVPGGPIRNLGSAGGTPTYLADNRESRRSRVPGRKTGLMSNTAVAFNTFSQFTVGDAFSIAGWLKLTALTTMYGCSIGVPGSTTDNCLLYYPGYTDGSLYVQKYQTAGTTLLGLPAVTGRWLHVAITHDAVGGDRLYRNGVLWGAAAPSFVATTLARHLYVGSDPSMNWQHFALWNRAITPGEIRQLARLWGT